MKQINLQAQNITLLRSENVLVQQREFFSVMLTALIFVVDGFIAAAINFHCTVTIKKIRLKLSLAFFIVTVQ